MRVCGKVINNVKGKIVDNFPCKARGIVVNLHLVSSSMKVSIIMGSKSDWEVMSAACETLEQFGVPYEKKVISAHRTPQFFCDYMASARQRGVSVVLANKEMLQDALHEDLGPL